MNNSDSQSLFEAANQVIPGGVNSPVRAFKSVGGTPVYIDRAEGPYVFDVDGNRYIDYVGSWGPMIVGHAHPTVLDAVSKQITKGLSYGAPTEIETTLASLVCELVPSVEQVRMVNSGTEAAMTAIRLARGVTGRSTIIKFEGCYHGHGDAFLIAAGSGAVTMGSPDSPGVTEGTAKDTLLAPFNDLDAVEQILERNKGDVAALIVEPVGGNMGCVPPKAGYLEGLRELCDQHKVVLIFDEVMTGFRLSKGGAQELLGVTPDMTTLGKIIGGGLPVGAYGGKKEIMDFVSPQGPVYQAGTLSGNPVAMAAGLAILQELNENVGIYEQLETNTSRLAEGLLSTAQDLGFDCTTNQIGSMYTLFFSSKKVSNFEDAKACDMELFSKYFRGMLERGIYLAPSQYESLFISQKIGEEEIGKILQANEDTLRSIKG